MCGMFMYTYRKVLLCKCDMFWCIYRKVLSVNVVCFYPTTLKGCGVPTNYQYRKVLLCVVCFAVFTGRCWAAEERGGGVVPLQRDKNFEMIILVTNPSYKV